MLSLVHYCISISIGDDVVGPEQICCHGHNMSIIFSHMIFLEGQAFLVSAEVTSCFFASDTAACLEPDC